MAKKQTTVQLPGYNCLRCEHRWIPRKPDRPIRCPSCKSAYWDRPVTSPQQVTRAKPSKKES